MKVVSFRLEEVKAKELETMAEGEQRTTGSMLRYIVHQALKNDRVPKNVILLINAVESRQMTRQEAIDRFLQLIDPAFL